MVLSKTTKQWCRWGLFNLVVVALYGSLMRYKIAFDFPFFNQKNLLHAHSHFAFNGWISHVLYSGLALIISPYLSKERFKKYNFIIILNLICSFGMLIAFTVQGYKAVSIAFSTLSIVVAIIYALFFVSDEKYLRGTRFGPWAFGGIILNIISSAGPLYLAYTLMSKTVTPNSYLGSIYYYLHFQYSGWFFLGGMAMIVAVLPKDFPSIKNYLPVFFSTSIITFFLSILWAHIPTWVYVLTVIAAIIQLIAWFKIIRLVVSYFKGKAFEIEKKWINVFFYGAAFAMTIKFVLQAVSILPSLSQLVFGLRPIVIAYLHLVLLGVYSLFIIGYLFYNRLIKFNLLAKYAAFGFLIGVILNELFLAIQGFTGFFYIPVPHINGMLFFAALVLFTSALLLFLSQFKKSKED